MVVCLSIGGEKGIRTLDDLAAIRAFQARALDQLCDLSKDCTLFSSRIITYLHKIVIQKSKMKKLIFF